MKAMKRNCLAVHTNISSFNIFIYVAANKLKSIPLEFIRFYKKVIYVTVVILWNYLHLLLHKHHFDYHNLYIKYIY